MTFYFCNLVCQHKTKSCMEWVLIKRMDNIVPGSDFADFACSSPFINKYKCVLYK